MTERERKLYAVISSTRKQIARLLEESKVLESQLIIAQSLFTEDEVINP